MKYYISTPLCVLISLTSLMNGCASRDFQAASKIELPAFSDTATWELIYLSKENPETIDHHFALIGVDCDGSVELVYQANPGEKRHIILKPLGQHSPHDLNSPFLEILAYNCKTQEVTLRELRIVRK